MGSNQGKSTANVASTSAGGVSVLPNGGDFFVGDLSQIKSLQHRRNVFNVIILILFIISIIGIFINNKWVWGIALIILIILSLFFYPRL